MDFNPDWNYNYNLWMAIACYLMAVYLVFFCIDSLFIALLIAAAGLFNHYIYETRAGS